MTNLEIKRKYKRKGWRFKVLALNIGFRASLGRKKFEATSITKLLKTLKENGY